MPAAVAGPVYLDSSALAKIYIHEADSPEVDRLLRGRTDIFVSDLAITEVISAFSRRGREGPLSVGDLPRLHQTILGEVESNIFARVELTPEVHRLAERYLMAIGVVALRASDALHLALATEIGARTVFTTDRRLSEAARSISLAIRP